MTREQELAILAVATTPRKLGNEWECRVCGAMRATRAAIEQATGHRPECPMIAVLAEVAAC